MIEAAAPEPNYLQPGLQPDEIAFTKLKADLRKASLRKVFGLWDALGRSIVTFDAIRKRKLLQERKL